MNTTEYEWKVIQVTRQDLDEGEPYLVVGHLSVPGFGTRTGYGLNPDLEKADKIAKGNAWKKLTSAMRLPEAEAASAKQPEAPVPQAQTASDRVPPPVEDEADFPPSLHTLQEPDPEPQVSTDPQQAAWDRLASHPRFAVQREGKTPEAWENCARIAIGDLLGKKLSPKTVITTEVLDAAFTELNGRSVGEGEFRTLANQAFGNNIRERIAFIREVTGNDQATFQSVSAEQWRAVNGNLMIKVTNQPLSAAA